MEQVILDYSRQDVQYDGSNEMSNLCLWDSTIKVINQEQVHSRSTKVLLATNNTILFGIYDYHNKGYIFEGYDVQSKTVQTIIKLQNPSQQQS